MPQSRPWGPTDCLSQSYGPGQANLPGSLSSAGLLVVPNQMCLIVLEMSSVRCRLCGPDMRWSNAKGGGHSGGLEQGGEGDPSWCACPFGDMSQIEHTIYEMGV